MASYNKIRTKIVLNHEQVTIRSDFDKRFMIGCNTPEQAAVFSDTLRVNGDGKFYVPRCHVALKLKRAKDKKDISFMRQYGYDWAENRIWLGDSALEIIKTAKRITGKSKKSAAFRNGVYQAISELGMTVVVSIVETTIETTTESE